MDKQENSIDLINIICVMVIRQLSVYCIGAHIKVKLGSFHPYKFNRNIC